MSAPPRRRVTDMPQFPPWVDPLLKLGVPGAIAVFLVFRLATGFDTLDQRFVNLEQSLAVRAEQLDQHRTASDLQHQRLVEMPAATSILNEKILAVLRQICVQQAVTPEERRQCNVE